MEDFLKQLYESLCRVEVKGRENMDIMLGCMVAIENAISQLNTPEETEAEDG